MIEMRLRRATGPRAVAAMAVVGFIASIVIDVGTDAGSEVGSQTDSHEWRAPARLDELYRRESIALAPAARTYQQPELAVSAVVSG